jgi:polysaccharide export outer membrane protein
METKPQEYRINTNDILDIQVQSSDAEVTRIFNLYQGAGNNFNQADPGAMFLTGYEVNPLGMIKLPIIGEIYVKDLTMGEIQRAIQEEVDKYIINATVVAKLVSFKVTVLGEVTAPGYYYVYNSQANIFEILGLAGDMTVYGKRDAVKLLRQTDAGTTVVLLDLTDPNLIESDYYFTQPNDIIYVEPFRATTKRDNLAALTYISLFTGLVSTTILILNYINPD